MLSVLVLCLQNEDLNISWIYPTVPFQYLKIVFAIQYSTLSLTGSQLIFYSALDRCDISDVNLGKNEYICFELFEVFFLFFFKIGNHEEHP